MIVYHNIPWMDIMEISMKIQLRNHTQGENETSFDFRFCTFIHYYFWYRGIKKSFFERIGLKKKPQSLYSTEYEEEAEVQSNFSISSPDDDEEEEEDEEEDSPPQINTASPTPSSILPQPYDSSGQYIKVDQCKKNNSVRKKKLTS